MCNGDIPETQELAQELHARTESTKRGLPNLNHARKSATGNFPKLDYDCVSARCLELIPLQRHSSATPQSEAQYRVGHGCESSAGDAWAARSPAGRPSRRMVPHHSHAFMHICPVCVLYAHEHGHSLHTFIMSKPCFCSAQSLQW